MALCRYVQKVDVCLLWLLFKTIMLSLSSFTSSYRVLLLMVLSIAAFSLLIVY
ncbi:unnamed protein product [Moneuplotes crassus]|uniref:Uncharacterized protein n=1 Tax=Euplotes crassus TaxID=5936 RepID=A0AAD1XVH5_EUPCR|nr:unnamed protein product [Moneuplotes crassus]